MGERLLERDLQDIVTITQEPGGPFYLWLNTLDETELKTAFRENIFTATFVLKSAKPVNGHL